MCGRASLAVHVNPRNLSPHVPCVRPGNPGTWVFAPLRLHVRRYGAGGVGSALLHWALSGAPHNYFFLSPHQPTALGTKISNPWLVMSHFPNQILDGMLLLVVDFCFLRRVSAGAECLEYLKSTFKDTTGRFLLFAHRLI